MTAARYPISGLPPNTSLTVRVGTNQTGPPCWFVCLFVFLFRVRFWWTGRRCWRQQWKLKTAACICWMEFWLHPPLNPCCPTDVTSPRTRSSRWASAVAMFVFSVPVHILIFFFFLQRPFYCWFTHRNLTSAGLHVFFIWWLWNVNGWCVCCCLGDLLIRQVVVKRCSSWFH